MHAFILSYFMERRFPAEGSSIGGKGEGWVRSRKEKGIGKKGGKCLVKQGGKKGREKPFYKPNKQSLKKKGGGGGDFSPVQKSGTGLRQGKEGKGKKGYFLLLEKWEEPTST